MIIGYYITKTKDHVKITENGSSAVNEGNNLLHYIIPISAKSWQSMESFKQVLINYLSASGKENPIIGIQDIAYTLQERREYFNYRSAYCVKNIDDLISKLKLDTSYSQAATENSNKVVFMFPGQGSQYTYMAESLYENEPLFKTIVDQCIALANQHLAIDLFEVLYLKEDDSQCDINETEWTQISLFVIEYALAKYLEYLVVKADAYIGHSIGEFVADTLSGVFTLEDAIKVVIVRGKLMQSMHRGSMLTI